MRAFAIFALPALAAAQGFDFSIINAQAAPTVASAPIGGSNQTVAIQPYAVIPSIAASQITSNPLAKKRSVPEAELIKRDGTCDPQPNGTGPAVHNPDTPDAFESYKPFSAYAYSAPIPRGYALNFTNLESSTSTSSYLGYTTLNSYDTLTCASKCNDITGCVAFNIYFERDPSLDPNAQQCPNPPSVTNIKCVWWGVPVSKSTATNSGQYRDSFEVVIAGSNGYNAIIEPAEVAGFSAGVSYGGALNVPNDPVDNQDTYITSKFYSYGYGPYQIQYYAPEVCVHACADQTAYDYNNPPSSGRPAVCNQVVALSLNRNGVPQGMYCSFFTESWGPNYGTTNYVVYAGSVYTVDNVFSYVNSTYAASYNEIGQNSYQGGSCGGYGPGTC